MRFVISFLALAFTLPLLDCTKSPSPPPAPKTEEPATRAVVPPASSGRIHAAHADASIAWQIGDVEAAFAMAKSENKPVFLYWGAVWCPPCNQVKATIFNRRDFIERARFFVPVYIDGDSPSAQRLGARFNVSGYPTMILFTPDGTEITRLPGEVDGEQYMRVLTLGMNAARPVKDTLAAALSHGRDTGIGLSPEDWRMLAYYSWDTDEQQLVTKEKLATTLNRLAQSCPGEQTETRARLHLKALMAAATAKGAKPHPSRSAAERVAKLLADNKLARENFDLLTSYAGDIAGYITAPKSAERAELVAAWNAALDRLISDTSLSSADQLTAVDGQVALAKLDAPKARLPEPLQKNVRDQVARADRETSDPYARQSVISAGASLLTDAGLLDESDALLTAELERSHSPYYFMLGLAVNAKKRGDKANALEWYEKAYAAADGPATRLQWGVSYVNALVDLAPQDTRRIEKAATSVIGELDATPDTFYERNRRALERMSKKLSAWNKDHQHSASLQRIRAQMVRVCGKLPTGDPARATCEDVVRMERAAGRPGSIRS